MFSHLFFSLLMPIKWISISLPECILSLSRVLLFRLQLACISVTSLMSYVRLLRWKTKFFVFIMCVIYTAPCVYWGTTLWSATRRVTLFAFLTNVTKERNTT